MNVFDLEAKLGLDASEYESGLDSAKTSAKGFASSLKSGLKTAGKIAAGAVAAVGTASVALVKGTLDGAASVAKLGDNIDKMSQKLGMSSTTYQEWDAILQHCGTNIESMQTSMKTLANAAETGNEAFEKLGMSQEDIANMSQEELFSATITALQGVSSETERTYLAGKLLGRGATELGALLNLSAEDVETMRQAVHDLGGVMSEDSVKAAARYMDSLQDMQTAFGGLKNQLLVGFLPSISTVMDGLAAVFSGNSDSGIGLIKEGISSFAGKMTEVLPKFLELGKGIISALSTALLENLPELLNMGANVVVELITGIVSAIPQIASAIPQVITTLITALTEAMPEIAAAGREIITSLASGLSASLPVIIPAIAELLTEINLALTDPATISALVDGAISIVQALADGIIAAVPILLAAAPKIIKNFLTGVLSNIPKILQAGIQLIQTLIDGVIENLPLLIDASIQIITALLEALIENLPLIIDASIQLMVALVTGLVQSIPQLIEAVPQIIQALVTAFITYAPQLVAIGVQLLVALVTGIGEALGNAVSIIGEKISEWVSIAKTKVTDFANAVHDGFNAMVSQVGMWVQENIITPMRDAISAMVGVGKSVVDQLLNGIKGAWSQLTSWVTAAWNRIKSIFTVTPTINEPVSTGHAIGLDYVPVNNYPALLHRGEAVLTAREADEWRRGNNGGGITEINQYIQSVPQTPVELADATAAYFEQARWAV